MIGKPAAACLATAAAVLLGAAAPAPPPGWRAPTTAEAAEALQKARTAVGQAVDQKLAIQGDFDGDGQADEAAILMNTTQRFAVFVLRAKTGRYEQLAYSGKQPELWNYTLRVEPPGAFKTACGKGFGDESEPCRREVRTRWPAIGVSVYEGSHAMFFWDGRRFDSEFLSD